MISSLPPISAVGSISPLTGFLASYSAALVVIIVIGCYCYSYSDSVPFCYMIDRCPSFLKLPLIPLWSLAYSAYRTQNHAFIILITLISEAPYVAGFLTQFEAPLRQ
ncbi:hypothetical protein Tco_0878549 [Tanacetum coccineum]|uniref:Uncharacterized protein n=1 Tax=Tanacetum coccineum TaxID=301880 RepID=A0ABQ5C1D6_9ASTR